MASLLALKNFFQHEKESKQLIKQRLLEKRKQEEELRKKKEQELLLERKRIVEEEIKMLNIVLQRNWFLNAYDITQLLMECTDESYDYVDNHRFNYPPDVRDTIEYMLGLQDFKLSTKSVVSINDDQYYDLQEAQQEERERRLEAAWEERKKNLPARPLSDADQKYDELYLTLQKFKKHLEEETAKANKPTAGKYIPPSLRGKGPVVVTTAIMTQISKDIERVENEIKLAKEEIEELDNGWIRQQRTEFEEENFELLYV